MATNRRLLLPLALVLAVAVRGALLLTLSHSLSFAGTTLQYGESAHLLATGHGFAAGSTEFLESIQKARGRLLDPEDFPPYPDSVAVAPTMVRQPGYSFLLAGTFLVFGRELYLYLQAIQVLVDGIGATLLVFWIGRHVFGRAAGVGGALLYAASPLARIAVHPLPDAWISVVVLAALAALLRHLSGGSLRWLALAGLALGLGANLRQEVALLLVPAFGAAAALSARRFSRGVLVVLVAGAVAALCLAPWMVRNLRLFGTTRAAVVQAGGLMWEGIGDYSNRLGAVASDSALYAHQRAHGYQPRTPEADAFVMKEVRGYLRDHPVEAAGILARQIVRTLVLQGGDWEPARGRGPETDPARDVNGLAARALLLAYRVGLFVLVVTGLYRGRKRWTRTVVLLAPPLAFMIPQWLIVLEPRHVLVATGPLYVLAACGLWGPGAGGAGARPGGAGPGEEAG
jgi:4-amino-4-deoxy-L-arabinose transferase-like glycosyltransferase